MSFWNPLTYFNGSAFYKKKRKYESEYFERAKAIAKAHKLVIKDYYENTQSKTLSEFEFSEYKQFVALKQGEKWKKNYEKKALAGSVGSVVWSESERTISVKITRKGLKNFTDALANYRATIETGYVWHLVDRKTYQGWIIQATIQIAMLLAAQALASVPIVGQTNWLRALIQYTSWYGSLISFMSRIIYDLTALYEHTKITEIQAKIIAMQSANDYLAQSNDLREHKKYSGQEGKIFNAYRAYANGDIYKSEAAGSESFIATRAFNPTAHIINQAQKPPFIDEQIQNRAHYTLAGNTGAFEKNCPNIPLKRIEPLNPDSVYKLNFFTLQNQRLQRGYSELAPYLSDEDSRLVSNPASARAYIQALYDEDIAFFADNYYDYLESKDFLNKLKNYNNALRADFNYYHRKSSYESQNKAPTHTFISTQKEASYEDAPNDLESQEPQSNEQESFLNLISTRALRNEYLTEEEKEQCFEITSPIFKATKKAFLEQMENSQNVALELLYEMHRQWYIGEYKGYVYDVLDSSLIEREYETYVFIKYALKCKALKDKGGYAELYTYTGEDHITKSQSDGAGYSHSLTIATYETYAPLYTQILFLDERHITRQEAESKLNVNEECIIAKDEKQYILYAKREQMLSDFKGFIQKQALDTED